MTVALGVVVVGLHGGEGGRHRWDRLERPLGGVGVGRGGVGATAEHRVERLWWAMAWGSKMSKPAWFTRARTMSG